MKFLRVKPVVLTVSPVSGKWIRLQFLTILVLVIRNASGSETLVAYPYVSEGELLPGGFAEAFAELVASPGQPLLSASLAIIVYVSRRDGLELSRRSQGEEEVLVVLGLNRA